MGSSLQQPLSNSVRPQAVPVFTLLAEEPFCGEILVLPLNIVDNSSARFGTTSGSFSH